MEAFAPEVGGVVERQSDAGGGVAVELAKVLQRVLVEAEEFEADEAGFAGGRLSWRGRSVERAMYSSIGSSRTRAPRSGSCALRRRRRGR